jgi:hypothetical protein
MRWGWAYLSLVGLSAAARLVVAAGPLDTKTLVAIAARHHVPLPPKKARLVLAHTESWSCIGSQSTSRDPAIYSPAFLLEEKADTSAIILRGMERQTLEKVYRREPLWRPFSLKQVKPRPGGHVVAFDYLSAFVCAVQAAARGDEPAAQGIWQRFAADRQWPEDFGSEDPAALLQDPRLLLGRCVFDHLRQRLLREPEHWPEVYAGLKALFKEFPKLETAKRRRLFEDLGATLRAKAPAKHSTEALLLDWARKPSAMKIWELFRKAPEAEVDAPARRIVLGGFAVVPDLIALLEDRRVTAHEIPPIWKRPAQVERLGELAEDLLNEISGMGSSQVKPRDASVWRAWWKRVRGQREQDFLVAAVLTRRGRQVTGVNQVPARILAHKFPETLAALCEDFSRRAADDAQPFALAEAVAVARLPRKNRVKLLTEFGKRGSLESRRCVLQVLARLDQPKCTKVLQPLLRQLSRDSRGTYWLCAEAAFSHVIMEIEDDAIWRDYLKVARRSSVGLRLEMMNPLDYAYIGNKNRSRRLAFLAAFLGDKVIRDVSVGPGRFEGPCAAFTIPRIAVRDFAAMEIASILKFKEEPDEFWDAKQWANLRLKVRRSLAGMVLPKLE